MFPGSTKKTKVSNEVRFANLVIRSGKQNNDDVVNVEKQDYIFVKNSMLLYT